MIVLILYFIQASPKQTPTPATYIGGYNGQCRNSEGKHPIKCRISGDHIPCERNDVGCPEGTKHQTKCREYCNNPYCIAVGVHYSCDRMFFSNYENGKEYMDLNFPGVCRSWEYVQNDGNVFCSDPENDVCGNGEPTNGCYVKQGKQIFQQHRLSNLEF